jgi:hypothetical protein
VRAVELSKGANAVAHGVSGAVGRKDISDPLIRPPTGMQHDPESQSLNETCLQLCWASQHELRSDFNIYCDLHDMND